MVEACSTASQLFRRLNGVFCFYKPSGCTLDQALTVIQQKLAGDLSLVSEQEQLSRGRLSNRLRVVDNRLQIASSTAGCQPRCYQLASANSAAVSCAKRPDRRLRRAACSQWLAALQGGDTTAPSADRLIASHARLIYGPAFLSKDIRLAQLSPFGPCTSGVVAVALNKGVDLLSELPMHHLRTYRITARLGLNTHTHFIGGRVTDRATYEHVTRAKLETLLGSVQAAHQRVMYEQAGVPINSHAAYQLACAGLPRPADDSTPLIYAVRLLHYAVPFFTLDVHAICETESYLLLLVQDIGRQLRSAATTVRLRCIRHGPFRLRDALLLTQCTVPAVCAAVGHSVPTLAAYIEQARSPLLVDNSCQAQHTDHHQWPLDDDCSDFPVAAGDSSEPDWQQELD